MQSTRMNAPLATGAIVRHGTAIHGSARVRTLQPDGTVSSGTFAEVGSRSAQLAHALRACGITGDERVVTFMGNNQTSAAEQGAAAAPKRPAGSETTA